MQGYNVIAVYNQTADKLLMCTRKKNPYKGLSNFVGGKIEDDEDGISAAYRELYEETTIARNDIILTHLMDFTYHIDGIYVEVYVGKLIKPTEVFGDENDLYWSELDCDFFDVNTFAGEGNIGHILEHIHLSKDKLLI